MEAAGTQSKPAFIKGKQERQLNEKRPANKKER